MPASYYYLNKNIDILILKKYFLKFTIDISF